MLEVIISIILLGQFGYIFYLTHTMNKERKSMVKAIMAKDLPDLTAAEAREDTKEEIQPEPDEVELTQADEELFDTFIKKEIN